MQIEPGLMTMRQAERHLDTMSIAQEQVYVCGIHVET